MSMKVTLLIVRMLADTKLIKGGGIDDIFKACSALVSINIAGNSAVIFGSRLLKLVGLDFRKAVL